MILSLLAGAAYLIGGMILIAGGACLAFDATTWLLERTLRNLQIYSLFFQFMGEHFRRKRAATRSETPK